jgi:cysteine desulfurase
LPTHQIAGMGMAFKIAQEQFTQDAQHIRALHKQLISGLMTIPDIIINSVPECCVPGIVNISCPGVEGESLLLALEPELAVSSGSACTAATIEVSHVLSALGIPAELAHSSLRISFGRFTTASEITKALEVLQRELKRLRALSSAWS